MTDPNTGPSQHPQLNQFPETLIEKYQIEGPVFIGVDPGIQGAIAMIDEHGRAFLWDMPSEKVEKREALNVWALGTIMFGLAKLNVRICVVEDARGMPKQSSVATFKQGSVHGATITTVVLADLPHITVFANIWKNKVMKGYRDKKNKHNAISCAKKIFPKLRHLFRNPNGKIMDGRAEALLLAEYAIRLYENRTYEGALVDRQISTTHEEE